MNTTRRVAICPLSCWVEGDKVGVHEYHRINKAIELAAEIDDGLSGLDLFSASVRLILTGGKPPNGSRIHAEVLRDYVGRPTWERGWYPKEYLITSNWVGSDDTFKDMLNVISLAANSQPFKEIVIVTSWYHVPRVKMIIRILKRHGLALPVRVVGARHPGGYFSLLREGAAICLKTSWQVQSWAKKHPKWLKKPRRSIPDLM